MPLVLESKLAANPKTEAFAKCFHSFDKDNFLSSEESAPDERIEEYDEDEDIEEDPKQLSRNILVEKTDYSKGNEILDQITQRRKAIQVNKSQTQRLMSKQSLINVTSAESKPIFANNMAFKRKK